MLSDSYFLFSAFLTFCSRITTYINNLHPVKEKSLYELIQKLIDASIPLWETTLAPLNDPDFGHSRRIVYDCPCYDPDPGSLPETEGPQQGTDEDEDDYWDRRQEWIEDTRRVIRPEPEGPFMPVNEPAPLSLREKWGKRGLQVIVKLANIELTPEKPEYAGGSWHVEGQMVSPVDKYERGDHITSLYRTSTLWLPLFTTIHARTSPSPLFLSDTKLTQKKQLIYPTNKTCTTGSRIYLDVNMRAHVCRSSETSKLEKAVC